MKASLFCFVFFISLNAFTQNVIMPTDSVTGLILYTDIETIAGQTKNELYMKAREWFVNTYRNANSILQLEDKESGKLMGKATYQYKFVNGINESVITLTFTINIDIKDGKYRCKFYDFSGVNTNSSLLVGHSTNVYVINYDEHYRALKEGKRETYNNQLLIGLNNQVGAIEKSFYDAMIKKANSDF